ncbi:MAG: ATP-binding protein [Lachnospiraceae bacterium]|nr:ATP-binding protein [Lachnospiraceae bacterium]
MEKKWKLPMGIEDFERIQRDGFYYVDKTRMIRDLLENMALVNLFTRPRRFGKTLNMSMLKHFFDTGSDNVLFDGLEISGEKELCDKYMGKFPVISISLKNAASDSFSSAKEMLCSIIGQEALRFPFLSESGCLSETERRQYNAMIHVGSDGVFTMKDSLLKNSLLLLSRFLQKHYGQKTILLIDEYDVPIDYAYRSGYYDDMVRLVRTLFGAVFKTNDSLEFAVLTGCLRISKESIFTGLNNFKVYTIKDVRYKEYFGFTDTEVRQMLEYYGLFSQYDAVREWYDGYLFGNLGIYCPWDVINYCGDLRDGSVKEPQNYWVNTSSNDIIKKFLSKAKTAARNEIEQLINGNSIRKMIRQELTYRDLDSEPENLWSILFTTGYLTQCSTQAGDLTDLVIPNREIQWIFVQQIREWFNQETVKNMEKLESFCMAFQENDTVAIEEGFNAYLKKTISIRDTNARKEMKENFYHGILLGLFGNMDGWDVQSNAESGDGYSDISIEIEDKGIGIIIELKYAEKAAFDTGCHEALKQINDRNYAEKLIDDGMTTIRKYGIACYKRHCKVISG